MMKYLPKSPIIQETDIYNYRLSNVLKFQYLFYCYINQLNINVARIKINEQAVHDLLILSIATRLLTVN